MARRNSSPRLRSARGNGSGRGTQIVRARSSARIGVIMKRKCRTVAAKNHQHRS